MEGSKVSADNCTFACPWELIEFLSPKALSRDSTEYHSAWALLRLPT